jgi:hypothetical protein
MVPKVLTMTSRAASEQTRPTPIFQLNPSGRMTGSMVCPSWPAKLCSMGGGMAVDERQAGQQPQEERDAEDDRAGALEKHLGAVRDAEPERAQRRTAVGWHFKDEGRALAAQDGRLQNARRDHRGHEAEHVQAQQGGGARA